MTVAQNIGFGLEMLGKPKAEIEARVAQMLKLVKMEALKARRTSQISGGQQQRVALARALAPQPKVLLLDEPLSALDYKLRKEMQIELKRLQHETGITFIFVTHDQEEALTMSDRIAVMSAGKILQVGAPRDIYDRPAERFVADFIGETNFLQGTVVSKKTGVATVKFAGDATISAGYPEGFDPSGEVTLVVRPEHADLVPDPAKGTIAGTLSNIVYFGTDTHYHVKLDGGEDFIVRHQNSRCRCRRSSSSASSACCRSSSSASTRSWSPRPMAACSGSSRPTPISTSCSSATFSTTRCSSRRTSSSSTCARSCSRW